MEEIDCRRKSTTDHINHTWSICQYYFTHNNGSSDDVLLRNSMSSLNRSQFNKVSKRYSQLKRNHTYPRHEKRQDISSILLNNKRRWTTIKYSKQKRQTLANILLDLTATTNTTSNGGNISYHNGSTSSLERKWQSIKLYNPQLDNEKILKELDDDLDEGYSHIPTFEHLKTSSLRRNTTTNTTITLYNDVHSLRNSYQSTVKMSNYKNQATTSSSHHNEASPSQSNRSSKREERPDENNDNTMMVISLPNVAEGSVNNIQPNSVFAPGPYSEKRKLKLHSDKDMILFLFGFLLFPIWWYGTYRYFTQKDLSILSKRQRCFQLLNYLSSIASLLILGLVVGLLTVWT